ncbi:MAG: N-acetyl-gamma-glutamyl-phosphate reductase [Candidatus Melainabacteria bacterium]|nr:N-acetyl-gamma-glutamyl-phosphate reductase [Candidatus Melainabacteria bacterium]
MKSKIGIIGATGYTGVVLTRLLLNHPEVEISYLSSEQHAGKSYCETYPIFFNFIKHKCKSINLKEIARDCNFVFFATPNELSKNLIPKLLNIKNDIKVIDLSADLRLEKKIKVSKNKFINVTYGLSEIYREEIKNSQIIANPGCYPTSVILALAPLVKNNIIDLNSIIIDSKSGISGAGRHAKTELQFCEINESFSPYKLAGKHRHIPEIEFELSKMTLKKQKIKITFSPHLLPVSRGILSTIYTNLKEDNLNQSQIQKLFSNYYKNERFVKVLPTELYANTKNVKYTNTCHISVLKDKRTKKLIVVSAIDNMVKGASGQAIQNMNIMLGFKEDLALDCIGQIP